MFNLIFKTRDKLERAAHFLADSRVIPGWHRLHLGHAGAELLQLGFILAVFAANLLYVLSINDFRTGYALVASAVRNLVRVGRPAGPTASA
jgi:hypothetical protein